MTTEPNKIVQFDDTTELEYIKNGEALTGYKSNNDVGSLNRVSKQLLQYFDLLKREIILMKDNYSQIKNEDNSVKLLAFQDQIDSIISQIDLIQTQLSKKIDTNVEQIENLKKEIDKLKKVKPTNFLDFASVQSLILEVETIQNRLETIQKEYKNYNIENNQIDNSLISAFDTRISYIEQSIRNLSTEIGEYNTEESQGTGIKSRIQNILQLILEIKRDLANYSNQFTENQTNLLNEKIDLKIFPVKVKNEQYLQVALELNLRIIEQQEKLSRILQKYNIRDELLEGTTLEEYLLDVYQKSRDSFEKSQSQLEKSEQNQAQIESIQQDLENQNNRLEQLEEYKSLSELKIDRILSIIGVPEDKKQIIGTLQTIEALKQEFNENIQNINMFIGQNTLNEETGFYRLLKDAKKSTTKRFKIDIPFARRGLKISIRLPDYIKGYGEDFIVTFNDNPINSTYRNGQLNIDLTSKEDVDHIIVQPVTFENYPLNIEEFTVLE